MPETTTVSLTPAGDLLCELAKNCKRQALFSSPFVNKGSLPIFQALADSVRPWLLTRTDLGTFASGASDVEAIADLINNAVPVRTLSRLHAKVYVFDEQAALVTSANATFGGLYKNIECGLLTTDTSLVRQLAKDVKSGFGADTKPGLVGVEDIEHIRAALPAVKVVTTAALKAIADAEAVPLAVVEETKLVEAFSGWTRLVLESVIQLGRDEFELDQLLPICRAKSDEQYPSNSHVRAKVRQQLQVLRDRGLVEFLGGGTYRRLFE
jgi:hypothetical protein